MEIANFVFKPKDPEIAKTVIDAFVNNWLDWAHNGFYYRWLENAELPEGYIYFSVEAESHVEGYAEACWSDAPVLAKDLVNSMFVVLEQEGLFDAPWLNDHEPAMYESDPRSAGIGTDNPKWYSFEDVALHEILQCLAAPDSRIAAFDCGQVYITEKDTHGRFTRERVSLIDYALKYPL
jgi:hypothetical protein